MPLVSVICNCFNHSSYVLEAMMSVMNQTYANIELIVINNGSNDNSKELISEYLERHPSIIFINLEKSLSHNQAFNLAFKQSKGDFLIDLSGDDRLMIDGIEKQVRFFQQQASDVGMIFANAIEIDENGNFLNHYFKTDSEGKVIDKMLFNTSYDKLLAGGLCMCSVSTMYSRQHFELLNGYNNDLFFEDLDYWLRLSYCFKIAFLDDFVIEKRFLNSSFGNQSFKTNEIANNISKSMLIIYKEAIARNTKYQNKLLLKRIHNSMERCYKNKNWKYLFHFSIMKLKCRKAILGF